MSPVEQISVTKTIHTPADVVWQTVGNIEGLAAWVPGVARVRIQDQRREITFTNGASSIEHITTVDEHGRNYSYDYAEGPLPVEHYAATIRVIRDDTDSEYCRVVWSCAFSPLPDANAAKLNHIITKSYEGALDNLSEVMSSR